MVAEQPDVNHMSIQPIEQPAELIPWAQRVTGRIDVKKSRAYRIKNL